MVKTTDPRIAAYPRKGRRTMLDRSSVRSVLFERIVNPVVMVICNVLPEQTPQVALIQRNNVVKKLSATAPDPTVPPKYSDRSIIIGIDRLPSTPPVGAGMPVSGAQRSRINV